MAAQITAQTSVNLDSTIRCDAERISRRAYDDFAAEDGRESRPAPGDSLASGNCSPSSTNSEGQVSTTPHCLHTIRTRSVLVIFKSCSWHIEYNSRKWTHVISWSPRRGDSFHSAMLAVGSDDKPTIIISQWCNRGDEIPDVAS